MILTSHKERKKVHSFNPTPQISFCENFFQQQILFCLEKDLKNQENHSLLLLLLLLLLLF